MLTLLCTAPSSSTTSPIEGSFPSRHAPPPNSAGASPSSGPSSSPTSARKLSILSNPVRRPSIRKRIQSLSRVSGASLDKATTTISHAAGSGSSKFSSFFNRHASSSSSTSTSTSSSSGSGPGSTSSAGNSGSGSAHTRGASTSSFASGKSSKSSGSSSPSRLNVLNIGPPSAFKHQFHMGPDSAQQTSDLDGPWDQTRSPWRQVTTVQSQTCGTGNGVDQDQEDNDDHDTPVINIDVVPPTASASTPWASTSSDSGRNVGHSLSRNPSHSATSPSPSGSISSPNLISIAPSSSLSSSPANAAASTPTSTSTSSSTSSSTTPTNPGSNLNDEAAVADKAKSARQAKRASLVKRKPVPPLYPEEIEPLPTSTTPNSPALAPATTFVLIPDPAPNQSRKEVKREGRVIEPETAPVTKTSFEERKTEENKEASTAHKKEETVESKTEIAAPVPSFPTVAPAHICILHTSPAPMLPPRRHTLAHMQARALGRGLGSSGPPSFPSSAPKLSTAAPEPQETKEKERKKTKGRARPVPFVAPSPGTVLLESASSSALAMPPGLSMSAKEEGKVIEEKSNESDAPQTINPTSSSSSSTAAVLAKVNADHSPRPSLASLASSESDGSTAHAPGLSSRSSSESGEMEMMEPRTPTDERRVSAGSAASISIPSRHPNRNKGVRIVLPGDFPAADGDQGNDVAGDGTVEEMETPKMLRRASRRPNPPVRRVETNEESVYVTADEADDL